MFAFGTPKRAPSPRRQKLPGYSKENRIPNTPVALSSKVPLTPSLTKKETSAPKLLPKTPQPAAANQASPNAEVNVFVRIRPLAAKETEANFEIRDNLIVARPPPRSQSSKHYAERSFQFTKIFGPEVKQSEIFESVAMPLLRKFMKGSDTLLFAYGATSAGKTYTVQGTEGEPGVLPRLIRTLLATRPPRGTVRGLFVTCVEVYNDRIHDLFSDNDKSLHIGKDGLGFTVVKDAIEIEIKTDADIKSMLQKINASRRQSSTRYNQSSSRSHCVFNLKQITTPVDETGKRSADLSQLRCSRLTIIDLAGSERVSSDETSKKIFTEASNINKSMLVLGRCIREIRKATKGSSAQIPFRESRLTELLRDFFDGHGKSSMASIIVNISPSANQFDDTLFSLQFAAEAVECSVKDETPDEEEDFQIESIDMAEEDQDETAQRISDIQSRESQIREEMRAELNERMKKIQADYQTQIEQMKIHSAQPYTSKLQAALAQRMQNENRAREIEEIRQERDREIGRQHELEEEIQRLRSQIEEVEKDLEAIQSKNQSIEGNIFKLINATKHLHAKHMQMEQEWSNSLKEIDDMYSKRYKELEAQLSE